MKQQFLLLLVTILALSSCKKIESDLIENANAEPIYKMEGSINNVAFDYTIDNETIFMSQGSEEINNVPAFYAKFENKENETSLKLSILAPERIYRPINEYSIADKIISFLVHEKGCYNLGFSNTPPEPPIIMHQKDGQFVDEAVELPGFGIFEIPIRFKGLSNETYYPTINHGFNNDSFNAKFSLSSATGGIHFESNNEDGEHQWFLNGQIIGQNPTGIIAASTGINTITHLITDNLGNKCAYSQLFYAESNNLKWVFETTPCQSQPVSNNFEEIVITYVENGITYSSEFAEENNDYNFSIKNIEYFTENVNASGISFKFDTEFEGMLYNADKSKKRQLSQVVGTCKYKIE